MKYFFGSLEIENSELTSAEVKKVWASVHPEIENAVAEEREDGIHFVQRSGTKG
jgi:dimeric dUTPase (all-alpha-NTP-PPase superfamily)